MTDDPSTSLRTSLRPKISVLGGAGWHQLELQQTSLKRVRPLQQTLLLLVYQTCCDSSFSWLTANQKPIRISAGGFLELSMFTSTISSYIEQNDKYEQGNSAQQRQCRCHLESTPFVRKYALQDKNIYRTIPALKTQMLNFSVKNEAKVNAVIAKLARSSNFSPYKKLCSLLYFTLSSITSQFKKVNELSRSPYAQLSFFQIPPLCKERKGGVGMGELRNVSYAYD